MGKITPQVVNEHTEVCKAHFSCFQHFFEYLQLANKDLDLGLHTLSVEQQWKQMWAVQDSLLSGPPNTVQGLSSSLGGGIPGEKTNCNLKYWSLFFHLLCLAFLGWYRWQRSQGNSHYCIGYAMFLQLISCYTTGVSQIRITGISLQNRSCLFTKGWCRQVYFGLPNRGALCRFKLQVKSKYSGTSKPLYYTRSMYILKVPLFFLKAAGWICTWNKLFPSGVSPDLQQSVWKENQALPV